MVPQIDVWSAGAKTGAHKPPQARRGRPGRRPPTPERPARSQPQDRGGLLLTARGSHMPLDTRLHWRWSNPLNVIPLLIVAAVALALVALIA